MEEQRSRRIQKIVDGLLPKTMDPKDRASETDLLLQFCLSLSKVSRYIFYSTITNRSLNIFEAFFTLTL